MSGLSRILANGLIVCLLLVPLQAAPAALQTPPMPRSEDGPGFVSIFDGKTLKGWDGNPKYWRVDNGAIVGETYNQALHERPYNSGFIIWRGGRPADFELKLEYRVSAGGNSGVQYRSTEVTDARWVMSGYQWDIDGPNWVLHENASVRLDRQALELLFAGLTGQEIKRVFDTRRWTGQLWEDNGRCFLALTGQFARANADGRKDELAVLADQETLLSAIHDDWNELHLIARGNQMIHILNGHVMSMLIDDDVKHRRMEGELGLQIHEDVPMRVEFRKIRLKDLTENHSKRNGG